MLQKFGYETETANDGGEAIERYTTAKSGGKPFDAVIMDLTIPNGMGGCEAARRLRELDPKVKAIAPADTHWIRSWPTIAITASAESSPNPTGRKDLNRILKEVMAMGWRTQSSPAQVCPFL